MLNNHYLFGSLSNLPNILRIFKKNAEYTCHYT